MFSFLSVKPRPKHIVNVPSPFNNLNHNLILQYFPSCSFWGFLNLNDFDFFAINQCLLVCPISSGVFVSKKHFNPPIHNSNICYLPSPASYPNKRILRYRTGCSTYCTSPTNTVQFLCIWLRVFPALI